MEEIKEISEKKLARRAKIKAIFEERRRKGYERYLKKKHKEMARKAALKAKKKEKERLKRIEEKALKKKKKKVGRPRKPGPKVNYYKRKKKLLEPKKQKGRKALPPFRYKIISCKNGLQNKFIGRYRSIEDAYDKFNELRYRNNNIIFPIAIRGDEYLEKSIDEYILIENNDGGNSLLRNEYGKFVEQKTNIDGWIVLDKFRYEIEETFWVWGYNKTKDRKTFTWIYENLIKDNIETPYDFKRILLYKNKFIIKDDDETINIVFCKHSSDAIRFYNKVEEYVKKDKLKHVLFAGDYSELSDKRRELEEEIIKVTGWTLRKIRLNGSTCYLKKK
jgi:hypothetical protein